MKAPPTVTVTTTTSATTTPTGDESFCSNNANTTSVSPSELSATTSTMDTTPSSSGLQNDKMISRSSVGGGANTASYIKASLSMTSLPPNEQQEGREVIKAKLRVERPYNSLKKKRNNERDTWRHSWGSGHSHSSCSLHSNATTGGIIGLVSGKDDFWAALQTNYNYIMDTNLLDSCKEARCEIEGAASVTANDTQSCSKMLDTSRTEGSSEDPKELRKWLRDMESKLEKAPSLSEATQLSIEELQKRLDEHSVLYREIVSHARVVGACIRASEKESSNNEQQNSSFSSTDERSTGKTPSPNAVAKKSHNEGNLKGLERRYHLLYLKAIEVQCLFEGLLGKKISAANVVNHGTTTSEETDEEPASKLARLSDSESDDATEHRVLLTDCCKKTSQKSDSIKADYADGDDEDEGDDEIDHPITALSVAANWSNLSFNTALTQERVHQCCIVPGSAASTDFDADSEGSDYEVIKRPRKSEKYISAASASSYRCLLSTPLKNHNSAAFNPFYSQPLNFENESVFVLSDTMDNNSLMQSKLLNGTAATGVAAGDKNSPKLLSLSNQNQIKQQQPQNQLVLVNTKTGTGATSAIGVGLSSTVLTSPCTNGNVVVGVNQHTGTGGNATSGGIRKRHRNIDISKFNESNRKSNSCAIFYFKHLDTDNETNFSGNGGISSSHESDISKSAEPSSDDDEGWLYTNSTEHCLDGNQNAILVNSSSSIISQDKNHSHNSNSSSHSQLSNDDSDKENKTSASGPSTILITSSSNNSPSIRSTSSLNSSSQIAITEIQLNGSSTSNCSGSTAGSFIGCATSGIATSTTVMHRSVMELQLGGNNNTIVQSTAGGGNKNSRSPKGNTQNKDNHFLKPTTPTKYYYTKFETTKPAMGHLVTNNNNNNNNNSNMNLKPQSPKMGGNQITTATFEVSPVKEISHESIKQLVLEAEHLVRDEVLKTPTKQQQKHCMVKISSTIKKREVIMPGSAKERIQEWLEHQPNCGKTEPLLASVPTTDCEASGEASETDSLAHGSDTSEGFTDSIATCMQTPGGSASYGNSIEHIGGSAEPIATVGSNQSLNAKVVRRQNRRKSDRPWSVSCLSQLTETNTQSCSNAQASQAGLATHSISESALDSLSPGRKRSDTQPSVTVKNSDSKGSLKRRKTRRKKQLGKKSESGSDGMLQIKTADSLSSGQTIQEITAALLNLPKSSQESGDESTLMKPNFRVGSYTTAYMTNESKLGSLAALATYMNEEDPQGEYTTGTEDHHSSFSETAWDNYQEKYNSENYSEGFDSDAARRLMEFGDDYRNFLDSQSDCCSSLSAANNLDSLSPPRMDSLQPNETKVVIQETIVSSVDHARRRRALELEYERRRKNLEVRRKSCQDDIQNIRSPSASLSSSANALTPKNSDKFTFLHRADSASRKLDFGMSHSAQSLRRTSESDTSSRRRKADDRRRSSRNLEKNIKLIPATSSSSDDHTDDEKEMRNLLTQSKNRLDDTRSLKIRSHLLRPEDYAEIITTCRDNIRCLDSVLRGPPGTVMSTGCLNATKDLLSSWEELLAWSENAAAARKMQEEMIILKSALNRLGGKLACDLDTEPSIQLSIEALKNEKSQLQTYRTNMLRLNASVHSWLTRQERKLAAELAEHEEAIKATEAAAAAAALQSMETASSPDSKESSDTVGNNKSVGTIAIDQDKHSQITTIIQSESEFHKHLKNEVSEMYSAWDEANSRINNQLEVLTTSLIAWRQLESGLYEFQQVLGKDRGTLKGLEGALDKGKTTPVELAQNVKLVAKLLSEKVEVSQEQLTAVQEHLDPSRILHIAQFTASNGSLSDSGISDGGATSDGGLSERERRLGVLRRLAKQLESALAPGSEAMKSIAARMESAETDLKSLQNTCSDLIVRTAAKKITQNGIAGDGDRNPSKKNSPSSSPSKRRNKRNKKSAAIAAANLGESETGYAIAMSTTAPDGGDPDDPSNEDSTEFDSSDEENKTGKPGWVKRIAKIAVPMQVALFTLLCAACMMQPNCCDNLNNLSMSFTPQLRYIRGPPPI